MSKKYDAPEMEIIETEEDDLIVTSTPLLAEADVYTNGLKYLFNKLPLK